ncbi:Retrovirus-related Pol polyprotein from type-1 retrotransposable element R1 [Araneus ventricosus]|uniref:Retrovirus-related Pol polyprotein from type-1 retrotransposable element R1 n=1 Tax=Araneus ventricosus TaxID=182803 RepID=A0A4Y2HA84_ARAVE|nr:Retrovirus-related Pol polyprotein from type-1 retrotransposable element R1 [Araneus ventricosus]
MEIKRIYSKGCPQGSVISPNLWNLYRNQLLSLNTDILFLQAFVDDLALVSAGRYREELENNTNKALNAIANKLRKLKLDLSVDKCQGLAFRSNMHYRQRCGQSIFNRNPIFKINGQSVEIGNSLKYLGILLDCRFTWSNHILSLHKKIYKLTINFNWFMMANWSIDKHLVKFWYFSVIEPALLYGAGVWGGANTVEQIYRLHTIQRVFLLKFLRPYRTTATQAFNVLSGIFTLHLKANYEYLKFQIWSCRSRGLDGTTELNKLYHYLLLSGILLDVRVLNLPERLDDNIFEVYIDGSKISGGVGFSVFILNQEIQQETISQELEPNNTSSKQSWQLLE